MKRSIRWYAGLVTAIALAASAGVRMGRPPAAYSFVVARGEDPRAVRLSFSSAGLVEIGANGRLTVRTGARRLDLPAPRATQWLGWRAVPIHYAIDEDGNIRFEVGPYDSDRALTITMR